MLVPGVEQVMPERMAAGVYHGARETGGILNWTAHPLWLYADVEPGSTQQSATPSDAVVI